MLTQERLKELLEYNPETGVFIRKKQTSNSHIGDIAGGINSKIGYHQISIEGVRMYSHRLAWLYIYGSFPEKEIDHVNGIRSDNRICNLRTVDRQLNEQNKNKANKNNLSGFRGVTIRKDKNYDVRIEVNGKVIYLGYFYCPIEGHKAYLEAKRKYHAGCTL